MDEAAGSGNAGALLVVCTANVCRSPLAAALLRDAGVPARIGSAGVRALVDAPMCAVSATLAPDPALPARHRARLLTAELVRDADLVLTMEREQRSAAVRLAPGSQATVFTLREAAALLAGLEQRGGGTTPDLGALAAALHGLRGLVPVLPDPEPPRRWWRRAAEPADPLTIVDGHGLDHREHLAAAEQVAVVARAVGEAISRRLDRAAAAPPEHG